MDQVYTFNQSQIKDCLTKHNCYITIDKIIKAQAFLNEYNLHLIEAIGCGAFGVVLKAYDDYDQRNVAVKIIISQNLEKKIELEDEIKINRKIRSEYVIKIFEHFYDEQSSFFMIVMEYCQKGDLHTYIKNKKSLEKDEIISLFTNILLGLTDIHKKNIIHSDLKPQNILLVDNQKLKICDLGLSKIIKNDKSFTVNKGGTPLYEPIEQMYGEIRLESDYYSAGSILCFLSGLEIESDLKMMLQLKNGIFPNINNKEQKELIEIGFQMMCHEPSKRIKPEVAYEKLIKLKSNSQQIISQTNTQKKEESPQQKNSTINLKQSKEIALNQLQKDLSETKHQEIDFNSNQIQINLEQIIIQFCNKNDFVEKQDMFNQNFIYKQSSLYQHIFFSKHLEEKKWDYNYLSHFQMDQSIQPSLLNLHQIFRNLIIYLI